MKKSKKLTKADQVLADQILENLLKENNLVRGEDLTDLTLSFRRLVGKNGPYIIGVKNKTDTKLHLFGSITKFDDETFSLCFGLS
jgi:hypothetical protein